MENYIKEIYNLYVYYDSEGDNKYLAEKYFLLSAEKGHPNAIWGLALRYLYGTGGYETDLKKGISLLKEAARKKSQGAYWTLAEFYKEGSFGLLKSERRSCYYAYLSESDDVILV